uniref:Mitogen-activated protein kinase kinase kinase kinase 1 n=2 Tax=Canis lupus familiaris TaxID=9615 RepID=A0A8C0S6G9_CANLF
MVASYPPPWLFPVCRASSASSWVAMAAAMAASRSLRDLLMRRLVAPTPQGLSLCLRPLSSAAQDEASTAAPREAPGHSYESLRVTAAQKHILHVQLNRPEKRNAMNKAFWREMVECFNKIAQDPDCRAVVISGAGKVFTAGIDLMDMASEILQPQGDDVARISWNLRNLITRYQETFSVIEKCPKPVIAAIHGACIGAGVDLITACDIRYCAQDAFFQVEEDKVMVLMDGSLKLVTPEGAPVPGLRTPEIPMTEAVEAVAMVGGRLQAFWKHGVQVWAPGSDQLLQELRDPTLTFRLLGSPRYGLGERNTEPGRGASDVERCLAMSPATCIFGLDILSPGLPASISAPYSLFSTVQPRGHFCFLIFIFTFYFGITFDSQRRCKNKCKNS